MSELHVLEPAVRAVEGKFDPKALEGRTILSSDWRAGLAGNPSILDFPEVIIEGEDMPEGVTAKICSIDATALLSKDDKSPERAFADMFMATATNAAGESVPFGKLGDGGKIVTTRNGEVVGIVAGGGRDAKGIHYTALVPAEQFNVGMPA